jgi:hypothetical protein
LRRLWQAFLFACNLLWPVAVLGFFMVLLMAMVSGVFADEGRAEGRAEYQGWLGRWERVVATAYTPSDPIDDAYHDTKGARWRWITADGTTDVRRHPYGVAVPLRHGEPWWPFGTRLIIPTGLGYLDRCREQEREFVIDDVGDGAAYFPTEHGHLHIDLRFMDYRDAIHWAGREGKRTIQVFVCEARAPVHEIIPPVHEIIPPVHEIIPPVHETPPRVQEPVWPKADPDPEPVAAPEPMETEAAMPMTDLMLLAVVALGLRNRYRRRHSWEPGRK